ncbi:MAG: pyridoxal-phosphate dependent enzyme, partial [Gemmatimonadetes bacterium]|nr:pyridoxal-phosphate dependent enzyme [Gemmatimonadota bacterium]
MATLKAPSIAEIEAARARIAGSALRTPLVRLNLDDAPAEIYLKLENLQPIGSFKLRGAGNAMALADPEELARGVYTASAGNMAQGVAWNARRLGIPATVIVPEHAPETKLAAIARLGGQIIKEPFDRWWQVLVEHHYPGQAGLFIHPVSDPAVMAGNGTIGLEMLEDLPDLDSVVVPYGGGGLSCGIASAVRALKPAAHIYAAEVDTAAPLAASLAADAPVTISYEPS